MTDEREPTDEEIREQEDLETERERQAKEDQPRIPQDELEALAEAELDSNEE